MQLKKKKCIKYELFQDSDNETIITIISEWEKIKSFGRVL